MKIAVKDWTNKDVGQVELDASIFGVDIREDILHAMVHYQLNKRRSGNHKTKTRKDVTGTGAKPWNQKGTGRARAGDLKRPQDIGGGVVFGPVVRSHATELPRRTRQLALKIALSAKARDGKLIIVGDLTAKDHKTKAMAKTLEGFGFESALIVGGKAIDPNFARATSNLPRVDVLPSQGANVYDILRRDVLILSKDAVNDLTEKLRG